MEKKSSAKKKNNLSNLLLLTWKRFVILILVFMMVVFFRIKIIEAILKPFSLYNFVYYGFSVGIPLYLLISSLYTLMNKKIKKRKQKKSKNIFDKLFLLSWKKTGLVLIAWIFSVVIHNLGSALMSILLKTEFEEAVFFIIAVIIIPSYFLISFIYTIFRKLRRNKK